jgi:hypothetical protein
MGQCLGGALALGGGSTGSAAASVVRSPPGLPADAAASAAGGATEPFAAPVCAATLSREDACAHPVASPFALAKARISRRLEQDLAGGDFSNKALKRLARSRARAEVHRATHHAAPCDADGQRSAELTGGSQSTYMADASDALAPPGYAFTAAPKRCTESAAQKMKRKERRHRRLANRHAAEASSWQGRAAEASTRQAAAAALDGR